MAATKSPLLPLGIVLLLSFILTVEGLIADIGDKRYYIVTGQKGNWFQANLACAAAGMTLTSIDTATENTNLKNYINNQGLDTSFWLAGSNLAEGAASTDYTWFSNGKALSYTKWASGHPLSTQDFCVFLNDKIAFETQACTSTLKNFICSRPLVPNCGITGRCRRNNFF